jgi:para-nitrobenzyl esterase
MNNRRSFIKKAGLLATAAGLGSKMVANATAIPAAHTNPEVIASANIGIVDTTAGKVRGYIRNGIYTFKGVPYGGNTAGENRFMPPVRPEPWKGVRDALVYGPICPQKPNTGWLQQEYGFLYQWIDGFQDEDCLRLNVWSPAINDGKKRPVMFWIHGGGFFSGSSQEHPSYDGENLCRLGDVIVVSINHRLNVFGFLDLADYGQPYASSANVGMLDIVAALEWVRDHIDGFGGDKNNVTIFGQSGGGTKVITLMAMPLAKGLFHRAISQSNSIVQVATHEYSLQITSAVLSELGINKDNLKELQEIPAARLLQALTVAEHKMGSDVPIGVGRSGLQPVVDGLILPTQPFDPQAPSLSAHISFMVGTTRNEASASIDNAPLETLTEAGLQQRLSAKYGAKGQEIYRIMRKVHPEVKPVEILSFLSAQNPMAYLQAERKAAQQAADVFLYMFAWHTPVLDGRPRSFHCSEIPFAFYNTGRVENYTGDSDEAHRLADKVARAWINFARTGNPGHSTLPAWPSFNKKRGAMMMFNNTCEVRIDPDHEARLLLERIFYAKEV